MTQGVIINCKNFNRAFTGERSYFMGILNNV